MIVSEQKGVLTEVSIHENKPKRGWDKSVQHQEIRRNFRKLLLKFLVNFGLFPKMLLLYHRLFVFRDTRRDWDNFCLSPSSANILLEVNISTPFIRFLNQFQIITNSIQVLLSGSFFYYKWYRELYRSKEWYQKQCIIL